MRTTSRVKIVHSVSSQSFTEFNLEFYTEVQDLSYLSNVLSDASPRYTALNMKICELIEDYGLVGFETLAVEVEPSSKISATPRANLLLG